MAKLLAFDCVECGEENPEGNTECWSCHGLRPVYCKGCGSPNSTGNDECWKCHTAIEKVAPVEEEIVTTTTTTTTTTYEEEILVPVAPIIVGHGHLGYHGYGHSVVGVDTDGDGYTDTSLIIHHD
jgi:ribosomal protein L40E